MSEEKKYVTNFTFPNGETFYVKDEEAREDIEWLKEHGGGSGSGDTNVQSDWNQIDSTADDYIKNKPDIYTKNEVDQKLVGAMTYKGIKATVSELPNSGNMLGDIWHVNADGSEWAWNGSSWEELGSSNASSTDAVLYTSQTLTDVQQEQARENIGAVASATLLSMLIPILREGLYGTDQTAAITALEIALGGTPEPEDPIETYTPTMSEGYINPTNGNPGGTSTYKHTEIIPVREGDKVYGTTYDSTYSVTVQRIRSRFTAAYDANGEIYPSGGVSDQHDYAVETPFVVPSGVYGVVFSIVNSLANQVVVYVDKSERVGA